MGIKMTTIRDVAKLAGVSVATVSRALNNSGYVSISAREKVEKAVKELNFYPNEVARSLFQKKSKLIGLLLPDITNPFFPAIAKGVEDCVNERGYSLLLGNVEGDTEKQEKYLRIFEQNNIAGVISAVQGNPINLKNMPFVSLDRINEEQKYVVHSDDFLGGQLAAQAIIDGKAKKVVIMAGPENVSASKVRLKGNKDILDRYAVPYEIFQTESFHLDLAEETAKAVFNQLSEFDSVIASNDIYGLALITEAHKRGIKVPEELQVIGYDDMPFSKMMTPPLTTISQPAYEIGYKGAELLCNVMERDSVTEKRIQLPVTLIKRETLREKDEHE